MGPVFKTTTVDLSDFYMIAGTLELGLFGVCSTDGSEGEGVGGMRATRGAISSVILASGGRSRGGRRAGVAGAVGVRKVVYKRYRTTIGGTLRTLRRISATRIDRRTKATIMALGSRVDGRILGGAIRSGSCAMATVRSW